MTANVFAWANTLSIDSIDLGLRITLYSWGIGCIVAIVFVIYFLKVKGKEDLSTDPQDHFIIQGIILGLLGFFLGGLPVWMIGSQILVGTFADRYALAPMFGGIILLVSLVTWFGAGRIRQGILLAALFGLSVAFQIRTVNEYRINWEIQRNYYWQMIWRIPILKPGTSLLAPMTPFPLVSDYGVGFAVNLIYNPSPTSTNVPYWFFTAYNHLYGDIPDFVPGLPITYKQRIIHFKGSTSQSLIIDNTNASACLEIVGADKTLVPSINKDDIAMLGISNLDQIVNTPINTAEITGIFGNEPKHPGVIILKRLTCPANLGIGKE